MRLPVDGFPGGLFDFNGDGETDWGEMFLAYEIMEESAEEPEEESEEWDDDPDRETEP